VVLLGVVFQAASTPSPLAAQTDSCAEDPAFGELDFWVGEWTVLVDGQEAGTNRVEKILSDCALLERWTDASGSKGMSLFYYLPATGEWKQVWVTENAITPGGVKEKVLRAKLESGALQFEGDIALAGGGSYVDRTTLTPLPDGTVRQVIEVSRDRSLWQTVFDAIYSRQ
jgi:hypothetical protein